MKYPDVWPPRVEQGVRTVPHRSAPAVPESHGWTRAAVREHPRPNRIHLRPVQYHSHNQQLELRGEFPGDKVSSRRRDPQSAGHSRHVPILHQGTHFFALSLIHVLLRSLQSQVVPTKYRSLNSDQPEIQSNQYSVTEHMSHLAPGSGRGLPGIYFHYEVSPIHAVFEEKRGGTLRFLTSICAILGGMYSVMGLVDGIVGFLIKIRSRDTILN